MALQRVRSNMLANNFVLDDDQGLIVGSGNNIYIDTVNNRVGINTNSPTHDFTVAGNIHATGNITAGGDITLGDSDADTITISGEIGSDILPDVDNTYDLGSAAKKWAEVHATTFYGDGSQLTGLSSTLDEVTTNGNTTTNSITVGGLVVNSTGALELPVGTTAQRPASIDGSIRFNSDLVAFEGYDGVEWGALGGGGATYSNTAPSTNLKEGDLWFDTGTTGELYVYSGTEWLSVTGSGGAGFYQRSFVGDNTTTAYNVYGVTSSVVLVYINGVLVTSPADYSYANGIVTFVTAPALNDEINILVYGAVSGVSLSSLGLTSTDDLNEGSTNLYYTEARIQDYLDNTATLTETDTLATVTGRGATTTTNVIFNGTGNSVQVGDTLRIAQTGSGLRMTNVGAFDNDGSDNFRVYATNTLYLRANGETGGGIVIDDVNQNVTIDNDLIVSGNLTVDGTTTTINSTTLTVDDLNIVLASGASDATAANGAGITVDGANATLLYQSSGNKFAFNRSIDVAGGITATGVIKSESAFGGFITLKRLDTTTTNNSDIGAINFEHTDSDDTGIAATILASGDGSAGGGKLSFLTGTPSSRTTKLTILSNGNVGIGTDTPDEVLDVKGNFTLRDATGNLAHGMSVFGDDDQYAIFNQEASGDGGLRITTLSDSTVASSAFQVNAVATTVSNDGNNAVIRLRAAKKNGTTETSVDSTEDVLSINNTGLELIVVKGNGYMGMGTNDPSAMLHLRSGGSYQPHILLENNVSSAGDAGITFADSVENYAYRLGTDDSGNGLVITHKSGIDPQHGVDNEFFRITTSGNISIAGNFTPTTATQDLGSVNDPWQNIYTQDMHLSNESRETGNEIDGTKGNWTIQEGAEDLYIINNKTGKRFRFKLEELD